MTKEAIKKHGAKAVYQAASRHMEDGVSLASVGLSAADMAGVWAIQSEAYANMDAVEQAIDYAQAASTLESKHGMTGKRNAAKPEGEAATSQVFARVTPREKAAYVKAAKGKTLSEWVRETLNAAV